MTIPADTGGVATPEAGIVRRHGRQRAPATVALAGLAALAVAIGIGRFAFTPILPMMQADAGLSIRAGAWLASANYVGYLMGAITAIAAGVRPRTAIRGALITIGVATLGMGLLHNLGGWLVLRAVAGFASAWVLVFGSAWCLDRLATLERPLFTSAVFAGVGTGITAAGGFCLVLMRREATSAQAWIGLGALSLAMTAAVWPVFAARDDVLPGRTRGLPDRGHRWNAEARLLALCYGAFGFAYIIPATFLPVMARQVVSDPSIFGWAWPTFGTAAAASTFAAALVRRFIGIRRLWIAGHVIMAAGLVIPIVWPSLAGIVLAALSVGGTFMVITMVGMQEAQRVGGVDARRLMAFLTSAFAVGQIVGPMIAGYLVGPDGSFREALLLAAFLLAASAYALAR